MSFQDGGSKDFWCYQPEPTALSLVSQLAAKTYRAGSLYSFWGSHLCYTFWFSTGIALKNTEEVACIPAESKRLLANEKELANQKETVS